MRTFEFRDAKSSKFWNIDLKGNSFTVTYGKIGAAGQTQTKEFPDEARTRKEADKLVAEKVGKGYVETTPKSAPAPAPVAASPAPAPAPAAAKKSAPAEEGEAAPAKAP